MQACVGKQRCVFDVSALPFSCPGTNRKRLGQSGRGNARGGAASKKSSGTTSVTSLSAWYECGPSGTAYSEADLRRMFVQCSADILAALPSFDASARDAFMASHRAESNNTGNISEW